jgi:hypothetical protein
VTYLKALQLKTLPTKQELQSMKMCPARPKRQLSQETPQETQTQRPTKQQLQPMKMHHVRPKRQQPSQTSQETSQEISQETQQTQRTQRPTKQQLQLMKMHQEITAIRTCQNRESTKNTARL